MPNTAPAKDQASETLFSGTHFPSWKMHDHGQGYSKAVPRNMGMTRERVAAITQKADELIAESAMPITFSISTHQGHPRLTFEHRDMERDETGHVKDDAVRRREVKHFVQTFAESMLAWRDTHPQTQKGAATMTDTPKSFAGKFAPKEPWGHNMQPAPDPSPQAPHVTGSSEAEAVPGTVTPKHVKPKWGEDMAGGNPLQRWPEPKRPGRHTDAVDMGRSNDTGSEGPGL